eukprot:1288160-Rhodomonas_salina.1
MKEQRAAFGRKVAEVSSLLSVLELQHAQVSQVPLPPFPPPSCFSPLVCYHRLRSVARLQRSCAEGCNVCVQALWRASSTSTACHAAVVSTRRV